MDALDSAYSCSVLCYVHQECANLGILLNETEFGSQRWKRHGGSSYFFVNRQDSAFPRVAVD